MSPYFKLGGRSLKVTQLEHSFHLIDHIFNRKPPIHGLQNDPVLFKSPNPFLQNHALLNTDWPQRASFQKQSNIVVHIVVRGCLYGALSLDVRHLEALTSLSVWGFFLCSYRRARLKSPCRPLSSASTNILLAFIELCIHQLIARLHVSVNIVLLPFCAQSIATSFWRYTKCLMAPARCAYWQWAHCLWVPI